MELNVHFFQAVGSPFHIYCCQGYSVGKMEESNDRAGGNIYLICRDAWYGAVLLFGGDMSKSAFLCCIHLR